MVALPARPSPMAAPMAPPPSAIPNAIMAAAKWSIYSSSVCMLGLDSFPCETEVGDRQQHENEGLDESDETDVEQLPYRKDDGTDQPGTDVGLAAQQQDDDVGHEEARKEVAEQSHRECDRFHDLVDEVQRDEQQPPWHRNVVRPVQEVVANVPRRSMDPERVPLHEQEDHDAHGQRLVEVRVRGVQVGDQRDGQEVDPVRYQDVEVAGGRKRHD